MKRRDFIAGAASAVAMPLVARAQDKVRRVGALMNLPADDQQAQLYMAAFQQGLQELGWTIGRNLRLDHRWGPLTPELLRRQARNIYLNMEHGTDFSRKSLTYEPRRLWKKFWSQPLHRLPARILRQVRKAAGLPV